MKNIFKNPIVFVVLVLAIIAGSFFFYRTQNDKNKTQLYKTLPIKRGAITQSVSANGTLNPVILVNVGTQVSGAVKKLYVDFNDHVKQGQVLLELDNALLRTNIQQTEANIQNATATLELAQANARRMQTLYQQEYVSRQELDQAMQALKSARAQVGVYQAQLAKDNVNLNYSVIRSPVSGVVVDRVVDVGQTVAASFQTPTLIKIAQDLSKMQINSSFAEADIGNIRVGQEVHFNVDAFPSRSFKGVVKQIRLNPTTQQNVVTYDVVITVDNPENILLPGMTAYVNIAVARRKDVLLIPNAALRFKPSSANKEKENKETTEKNASGSQGDRPAKSRKRDASTGTVYVLNQLGELKPVTVTLGITNNRLTELVNGDLRENDMIVVSENTPNLDKPATGSNANSGPRMRMF